MQITDIEAKYLELSQKHGELKIAMRDIVEMTNAEDKSSYRSDDREGCLDAVFSIATSALQKS